MGNRLLFSLLLFMGLSLSLAAQSEQVLIKTKFGNMRLLLYDDTPVHRDNFVRLVKEGFYSNSSFHRVINRFMLQGGNPEATTEDQTLEAEINTKHIHKKGALVAAQLGEKGDPNQKSLAAQFYIIQGRSYTADQLTTFEKRSSRNYSEKQRLQYIKNGGTPQLDGKYTVFGEVIEGLNVIDRIAAVNTDQGNRPIEELSITIELVK